MAHTMVSSRTKWEAFFLDAGIPQRQATEYAASFSNNRMRLDMLDELSKEVLRDLGIKALGDIITILRYAKQKQFTVNRSPSPPDGASIITDIKSSPTEKVKSSVSLPTSLKSSLTNVKSENKTVAPKVNNVKTKPIKNMNSNKTIKPVTTNTVTTSVAAIPVKSSPKAMNTTKVQRLKLSERFDVFETEAKRKKVEGKGITRQIPPEVKCIQVEEDKTKATPEVRCISVEEKFRTRLAPEINHLKVERKLEKKDQTRQASDADKTTPPPPKPVQFTVQVPSKPPTNASDATKPKPEVTVVPARGKALNRSKHITSIFDRLDAPSSSSVAVELLNEELSNQKNNVFKRLGVKPDKPKNENIEVVTGIVPPVVLLDGKHKPESVFNRLGVHKVGDI